VELQCSRICWLASDRVIPACRKKYVQFPEQTH
jgi:hypothetical protein